MSEKTHELMMMIAEIRNAFGTFNLENLGSYIDDNYVPRDEYNKLLTQLEAIQQEDNASTVKDNGIRFSEDRRSGAV